LLWDGDIRQGDDPKIATVAAPALAPGTYIVQWSAVSALDGHRESGSYWFRVAAGPGQVGGGPGVAEDGSSPDGAGGFEVLVKGLGFLSALLLFGIHAVPALGQ